MWLSVGLVVAVEAILGAMPTCRDLARMGGVRGLSVFLRDETKLWFVASPTVGFNCDTNWRPRGRALVGSASSSNCNDEAAIDACITELPTGRGRKVASVPAISERILVRAAAIRSF